MRLTSKLCQQHLGWMFKKKWEVQRKRVVRDTGASAELEKFGIAIKNVDDVLFPKRPLEPVVIVGDKEAPILDDETNPNWHNEPCYVYSDENVLLEGLSQAQLLTNTLIMNDLPKSIEENVTRLRLPANVDENVQHHIMMSHIFDVEQVKLPVVKLPDRPAYKLPRSYGISQQRRMHLLTNKLISECEKWAPREIVANRWLFDELSCRVTLPIENDLLQFGVTIEKIIASKKAIEPVKSQYQGDLPDLYPLKATITIPKKNIYVTENDYALPTGLKHLHPHTMITHFVNGEVRNLHETDVTDSQWQSRTLIKAFAVAAARAKQLYGDDNEAKLPKPVVVQNIQTDGRRFHFGVFQLNTLDVTGHDDIRNYWFHLAPMDLFSVCDYVKAIPTLESYNKDVFRFLNAFYNTQHN